MIRSKVIDVLKRVTDAAAKSVYKQNVKLVAVSKTKTVEDIMNVYEDGIRDFG